jgi:hypothetical protein
LRAAVARVWIPPSLELNSNVLLREQYDVRIALGAKINFLTSNVEDSNVSRMSCDELHSPGPIKTSSSV